MRISALLNDEASEVKPDTWKDGLVSGHGNPNGNDAASDGTVDEREMDGVRPLTRGGAPLPGQRPAPAMMAPTTATATASGSAYPAQRYEERRPPTTAMYDRPSLDKYASAAEQRNTYKPQPVASPAGTNWPPPRSESTPAGYFGRTTSGHPPSWDTPRTHGDPRYGSRPAHLTHPQGSHASHPSSHGAHPSLGVFPGQQRPTPEHYRQVPPSAVAEWERERERQGGHLPGPGQQSQTQERYTVQPTRIQGGGYERNWRPLEHGREVFEEGRDRERQQGTSGLGALSLPLQGGRGLEMGNGEAQGQASRSRGQETRDQGREGPR
jgi:hypothetical protein